MVLLSLHSIITVEFVLILDLFNISFGMIILDRSSIFDVNK